MINRCVHRRRFLGMAGGALLSAGSAAPQAPAAGAQPQVLILGAGMAGAAAAYWLRKLGISAVVLEARDRIGGRLWTSTRWPDAPFDLGGAWITEYHNSPLTPLTKQFNIQTKNTDFFNFTFSKPNGIQYTPAQIASFFALYGTVFGQVKLDRAVHMARGFPDQPLQTDVDKVVAALKLTPEQMNGLNALIELNVRAHFVADLRNLSLYYYDQDKNLWPGDDQAFPNGYVQLVKALLGSTPVLQGQVVKQVQYGPQGVTVITNQGQYSAKCAVVTMSIGVLQSSDIQFAPALPAWKQGAINRLRMGNVNKLLLRFPRAFWLPQASAVPPNFMIRVAPQLGQLVVWFNAVPLTGQPLLAAFVAADTATQTESMTDAEVVKSLMYVLRQWYGPQGIQVPDPVDFQRSRWLSDPFARGAYSNIPVGSSGADYDLMALPVAYAANLPATANRLFFAGEATDRFNPATALGAYKSGLREATRIQQQLALR